MHRLASRLCSIAGHARLPCTCNGQRGRALPRARWRQAANSLGAPPVLPGQIGGRGYVSDTRGKIERLRREDPVLFERGGTARSALSGEEFGRDLWQALQDESLAERIKSLPWGSGSGMIVGAGESESTAFVFCARIGNEDRPVF